MKILLMTMAALLLLGACSSSGLSTEGVEITRADETTTRAPESLPLADSPSEVSEVTTTRAPDETTTEAPDDVHESDIPSDEELIRAATWDGRDIFSLTASDLAENYSSECTQSLLDIAGELVQAQGIVQAFIGVDEIYSSVASIEYQGDGSEALVFLDLVDGEGTVIALGDGQEAVRWIVEDGEWMYADEDCLADPTCDAHVAGAPGDSHATQCSWESDPNTILFVTESDCADGTAYFQVDRQEGGAWIGIPGGAWTELDQDSFTFDNVEALCAPRRATFAETGTNDSDAGRSTPSLDLSVDWAG